MAKNIEPRLRKIGEYLTLGENSKFVIPEYQRAYSWGIKQCDKLWQDLEDFRESGGTDPYFFGTIIINCQENDTKLSLIDGQQRTTTFILMLKALLIKLNKIIEETEKDGDSKGLARALTMKRDRVIKILYKVKDEEIYNILENFEDIKTETILENYSINELYKDELNKILDSKDLIDAGKKITQIKFKQKDNKYTNYFRNFKFFYDKFDELFVSTLNTFAEYILEKSEIIEIRSWNVEQAITMFNSLNSDGMPLLDADIISAKLYSNSGSERDDFNNNWEELKKVIALLEQRKIANIDNILMQYMYIRRSLDKEYISDTGAVSVTTPGLRRYYTEDKKELLDNPISLTARLLKISKIWDKISDYSIVQLAFKFNENIKIYLVSYLYKYELGEITNTLVTMFLHHLLRIFVILELVDIGYSSSKFKTFLFELNIKLVDKKVDLKEIKKDINNHINSKWDKQEIKENILDYTKNSLVYLCEYLMCLKDNSIFVLPEKCEVEHIMPRSGKDISQIRLDAGLRNEEEFLSVVNKVGNKMLLEENINRSISNAWFKTKIQTSVKEKSGYKDSLFLVAKKLVRHYQDDPSPSWTVSNINKRTEYISNMILDYIFNS